MKKRNKKNEMVNIDKPLPEQTRDNKEVKRLFEYVPYVDTNDDYIVKNMDNTPSFTPAYAMDSYLRSYDIGLAMERYLENNGIYKSPYAVPVSKVKRSAADGLVSGIELKINMMVFDAYKNALIKVSNWLVNNKEYIYSLCKSTISSKNIYTTTDIEEDIYDDDDALLLLDILIDRIVSNIDLNIEDTGSKYTRAFECGYFGSEPAFSLLQNITGKLNVQNFGHINGCIWPDNVDEDVYDKLNVLSIIAQDISCFSAKLTMNLYHTVYFIMAGIAFNQRVCTLIISAMDMEGIFTEYHDKIVSIANYALNTVKDYIKSNILEKKDGYSDDGFLDF